MATVLDTRRLDLRRRWAEGDRTARWRSAPGLGAHGEVWEVFEVDRRRRIPRHTHTAEEVLVVLAGRADVIVDGEHATVEEAGVALVPASATHEVRNPGDSALRFLAHYAEPDVETTFEAPVGVEEP